MDNVTLKWLDILWLWIILEYQHNNGFPPSIKTLVSIESPHGEDGLLYQWVRHNHPSRRFLNIGNFKNRRILGESITVLREAGMISPHSNYAPTGKAYDLFKSIGNDFNNWPLSMSVSPDPIPQLN